MAACRAPPIRSDKGEVCRRFPFCLTGRKAGHRLRSHSTKNAGGHAMSGTGLRVLSLILLVALVAYVAWSGGV